MNAQYCEELEKCWHLYYYFKSPDTHDYLNEEIKKFKNAGGPQIAAFTALCRNAFGKTRLTFDYATRVLGSNELKAAAGTRLDPVAKAVADCTKAQYIPGLLYKTRATKPLKPMSKKERIAELKDVYRLNDGYALEGKSILLIDDIGTTGTSFTAIATAVKNKFPLARVYGFSIAHTKSWDFDGVKENEAPWIEDYKAVFGK